MSAAHNEMGEMHAPAHASHGGHGHAGEEVYVPVFTGARKAELDELLTRYPTKMAALLPALWIVQEERGWVSSEGMAEVPVIGPECQFGVARNSLISAQATAPLSMARAHVPRRENDRGLYQRICRLRLAPVSGISALMELWPSG